jgi:[citrate (pro-3S)-lyase] ligase
LFDFNVRIVSCLTPSEKIQLVSLLRACELAFDEGADVTVLVEDFEGNLAATASLFGNVIRMVAVDPRHQESGLAAIAISGLMETSRVHGAGRLFLYTKPDTAAHFASLGFRNIAETASVALLETGEPSISAYKKYLVDNRFRETEQASGKDVKKIGVVVVNCNPFTLGHRYLIENALAVCTHLYVIVVEENVSVFSFEDRYEMVRAGIVGLKGVTLLRSGPYAVSIATFPTYFLKDRSKEAAAYQQTRLDLSLFLRLYVPALGINIRFAGTERNSPVTNIYNEAMKEMLPLSGVEFMELERKLTDRGDPVSASAVRKLIEEGDFSKLPGYLPQTTIEFLQRKAII